MAKVDNTPYADLAKLKWRFIAKAAAVFTACAASFFRHYRTDDAEPSSDNVPAKKTRRRRTTDTELAGAPARGQV